LKDDNENKEETKVCPNCGNSILLSDVECPVCGQQQEITQRMINDSYIHPDEYGKEFENAQKEQVNADPNFHEMNRGWATGLFFIGLFLVIASFFGFSYGLLIPIIIGIYIQTHSKYLRAEGILLWVVSIISVVIITTNFI